MSSNVFEIQTKVKFFINKNIMVGNATKIYVATSGGADSMALLSYMNSIKGDLDVEIGAVHVNHGIRGETARRDANFVRKYCEDNGIEFVLFDAEADNIEVPENASEEWARQLRYNYFNRLINKTTKIATAHTLSDQAETIIFRMTRGGSGLEGMTGIPVVRDGYIRPFLCINRAEVEQLVEFYGTGNITDETNLGDDYSRNKIRHNVIPTLKKINESFEQSIGKLCERMDKAQKYIAKQAKMMLAEANIIDGLKYKVDVFFRADDIILDEMVLQLLSKYGIQNEQSIANVEKAINTRKNKDYSEDEVQVCDLNNGIRVYVSREYITIVNIGKEKEEKCRVGEISISGFGYDVIIEEVTPDTFRVDTTDKYRLCLYTSESKLDLNTTTITTKRQNDKFKPACKVGGKVTKFMRAIPLAERDEVPMIRKDNTIVWMWGQGFTDDMLPTDDDIKSNKKIYRITWK